MMQPELSGDFSKIMNWADIAKTLKIRANAETPLDVTAAKDFGAEGSDYVELSICSLKRIG